MQKARKVSHSTQRKRLMNRHKVKVNNRRLMHFIQENQDVNCTHNGSMN
ncbi:MULTISPECIES: hypothetical protein [Thalassotalea]|nr:MULTISPECIES: hypothetical protein [Thalassotalea]